MTTTDKEARKYLVKWIGALVLMLVVPFVPVLSWTMIYPAKDGSDLPVWLWLWAPFPFILGYRNLKRVPARTGYTCPKCNARTARFEVVDGTKRVSFLDLVCPACGFRERSNAVQFGEE